MLDEEEKIRKLLIDSIPEVADIDCHKENIKPRPQGRYAAALLVDPIEKLEILKTGNADFQERLKTSDEQDDPLAIHLEYIKWTIEMYPSDDTQLLNLIKTATSKFVNELRYKHDPRYLKMWLEYATLVDAPTNIYSYLMNMDIGQSLALFYEEYATLLEGDQKYKDAERIYIQGIERQAAPLVRLEKNYKMFKARMKERSERGSIVKRPNFKLQMEALASGNRTMLGEKIAGQSRSQSSSSGLGGGLRNSRPTPSFEVYTGESTSQIPTPGLPTFNKTENETVKEQFAGATLPRRVGPRAPTQNFTKFTVYQDPDPEDQPNTPTSQTLPPPPTPPPLEEPTFIRKRRVEDLVDARLVQRFVENRDKYLQTKDSKGNTEYICVSKYLMPDMSYEECRPETVKGKKKEVRKYEITTTDEHTAETQAAIKDINTILFPEGHKEEEDLTWTKDIQEFVPIPRKSAREND